MTSITMTSHPRKRYAIVGMGGRAKTYVDAITRTFPDQAALVGMCDTSQTRLAVYQRLLTEQYDLPAVPTYAAADFERMIREAQPDSVIVTSVDATHHDYLIRAMALGCDTITEKPITVDVGKLRAIFDAITRTGRTLRVTFNYRYMPLATEVKRLIQTGVVGTPLKVDFMWVLDVRHGADYFRRWHRDKATSGGLLVHKASHHFDLINWWIASHPETVYALGDLKFYGQAAAASRGEHYSYTRYTGVPAALNDPFALRLDEDEGLKALYLDAEAETGYLRDRNVFDPGISIEDTLTVAARYQNGVQLAYSLIAYAPWEGYRVAITGTQGRLEVDDIEGGTTYVATPAEVERLNAINPLMQTQRLRVFPMWGTPYEVPIPDAEGAHGGGDERLLADLFLPTPPPDPYGRAATHLDGAAAALLGFAANQSILSGQAVRVAELMAR